MKQKKSFVMYAEWGNLFESLPETSAGTLIKAIYDHFRGEDPHIADASLKAVYDMIAARMDADGEKYEEVRAKRADAARSKWMQMDANASKSIQKHHDNENDNDNENVNVNVSSNEDKREKRKRFTPPTLEELRSYIREKGFTFDAETFIAYYDSNGWKIGRNPMKDWKAACRTWQQKEKERRKPAAQKVEPRDYDFDALEAAIYKAQSATV